MNLKNLGWDYSQINLCDISIWGDYSRTLLISVEITHALNKV